MGSLLILWASITGGSRQMAKAAADGARQEGEVVLLRADKARPDELLAAAGYLFVCPETLASMAGEMKQLFERCYYPLLGRTEGRPFATMICAGSDGSNAAREIARVAAGWRLRAVAEPLIVRTGAQTAEAILAEKEIAAGDLARCRGLGQMLGAGLAMGVF